LDEVSSDAIGTERENTGIRALNWNPRQELKRLVGEENWNASDELVVKLLRDAPEDVELLYIQAKTARNIGNISQYQGSLEDICQFDRENIATRRELANFFSEQNDWNSALINYGDLINHFASQETDDLLGYAQAAVKTDQPQLAAEAAQKVLASTPENGRALAINGYAEFRSGKTEQALANLSKAVEVAPEMADPWLMLAEVYRENGELSRSIDTLRTAHAAVPTNGQITRELATELIAQGQASEALAILNSSEGKDFVDLSTSLLKISAMKKLNVPELDGTVEKTYKSYSSNPDAIFEYAELLLHKGDHEKASKLIEPLAYSTKAKTSWKLTYADSLLGQDYRYILGTPIVEKTLQQKAGMILTDVLEAEPENLYANILAGEVALKNGEAEKAFNLFSVLLNNSEAQGSNWLDRIQAGFAWAANLLGKINYALAGIQAVVEANPNWAGARETLAEVSATSGDIEEAVTQANQVLESASNIAESVNWYADFMNKLGKSEDAEKSIFELAQAHAQKVALLLKLSEMKLEHGQKEDAGKTIKACQPLLVKSKSESELVRGAKSISSNWRSRFYGRMLEDSLRSGRG
jgi:tetratricopeptide (TPR) repeat protein